MNNLNNKYIECGCGSSEHIFRLGYLECDFQDYPEMFLEVQLRQHRSFFKKIWVAIKYVLGYECKYGHWDCTSLNQKQVQELNKYIEEFLNKCKKEI